MSKPPTNGKDEEEEIPPPQRPPSPPLHTTFAARGVLVRVLLEPMRLYEMQDPLQAQNFPAFKPRDTRITSYQGMTHVAWSCDGKKLAAVGTDKATRIWLPEKSVSVPLLSTDTC